MFPPKGKKPRETTKQLGTTYHAAGTSQVHRA